MRRDGRRTVCAGLFLALTVYLTPNAYGQPADAPQEATAAPKNVLGPPIPIARPESKTAVGKPTPEPVPASLTIDELEQMALANNPTPAQAAHRVEALQSEQLQVGLYPNPVIGQGNILKAQAELAAAQHEVDRVELLLQDRLAEVFRDFDVAREQVAQYRQEILPDAKRSLDLVRAGYQQSEFGYLELLTAQQTYARTNLAYVERLRDLQLRAVQIDGMLLTGGLEAPGP
jgi:outer membrane protein TolC